jgi:glycosidase
MAREGIQEPIFMVNMPGGGEIGFGDMGVFAPGRSAESVHRERNVHRAENPIRSQAPIWARKMYKSALVSYKRLAARSEEPMRTAPALIALALLHFALAQDPPQYGSPFAGVPDPRDASIYQVNIRAFSDKGFQGVTARLDAIQSLGVNIVYLMPCTPVGILKTANSPYCVRDYKGVNPEFGSLEDLRALIAAAHKRGMAVILDWVANHTAWDHPWITAHPEWYERDGSGAIQPAKVGGFTWNDVAELDFNNADMRLAMIDALRYWVFAVNCDGFRFDYVDGPPFDFWQQANGNLRGIASHKLILYAEGGRQSNYKVFDYNHGFSFYDALKRMFGPAQATALGVESENTAQYQGAGESNRLVRYITNHDVNGWDGPPQNLFGGQAGATAAFVLAAYNQGVPLIYNGQEIALDYALTFPFTARKIDWSPNEAVTNEYSRLIRFRNASAAIRRGTLASYSTPDVSAFVKTAGQEKALVLVNIRNRNITFTLPGALANTTWYNGFDKKEMKLGTTVELAPYQYLVGTAAPIGTVRTLPAPADRAFGNRLAARMEGNRLTVAGFAPGSILEIRNAIGRTVYRAAQGVTSTR